jgi:hypothetical protein
VRKSKFALDSNHHIVDIKTASLGKNSILSMKSPKTFIIKHKRSGSNEPRKNSNETIFTNANENNEPLSTHSHTKTSTFKDSNSRHLNESYKSVIEEKKSDSSGNSTTTLKLDSHPGSEEVKSMTKSDDNPRDNKADITQNSFQFEDSGECRPRSNSGIILRKGDQIKFDAKLGDILGEGSLNFLEIMK